MKKSRGNHSKNYQERQGRQLLRKAITEALRGLYPTSDGLL